PLLVIGATGMAVSLLTCAWAFHYSNYQITGKSYAILQAAKVPADLISQLKTSEHRAFSTDEEFAADLAARFGAGRIKPYQDSLVAAGLNIRASLGPVMWVLLSEIFPNQYRGAAISLVGFWNSVISATVTMIFPWELSHFGSAGSFLGYGLMAAAALVFVLIWIPETKGKTLEELEAALLRKEMLRPAPASAIA